MKYFVAVVACLLSLSAFARPLLPGPSLVYGEDNRRDLYEVKERHLLKFSRSSVALFGQDDLVEEGDHYRALGESFEKYYKLCPGERFHEQETAADCSGTLVGPDLVLTAGHCLTGLKDCKETRFAFGYAISKQGEFPSTIARDDVYFCKDLIHHENPEEDANGKDPKDEYGESGMDIALIRLDRPVTNHPYIRLKRTHGPRKNDPMASIGYPSGLPMKFAAGAHVRQVGHNYFKANLDVHVGNSGSPIFNQRTNRLEGILIEGEEDWEFTPEGCFVTKHCPDEGCQGESVLKTDVILSRINSKVIL